MKNKPSVKLGKKDRKQITNAKHKDTIICLLELGFQTKLTLRWGVHEGLVHSQPFPLKWSPRPYLSPFIFFSSVGLSLARLFTTWRLVLALQLNGSLAPRLEITTQPTNVAHASALSLNVQSKAISKPTLILWHLDHFNAWEQCSNVCDLFLSSWILNTLVGSYL